MEKNPIRPKECPREAFASMPRNVDAGTLRMEVPAWIDLPSCLGLTGWRPDAALVRRAIMPVDLGDFRSETKDANHVKLIEVAPECFDLV